MSGDVKATKAYSPTRHLRLISCDELARFDAWMEQHHRRGALRRIGHELHYVVIDDEKRIGLLSFSPASLPMPVDILRRMTWTRMSFSAKLLCKRVCG